MGGKSEGKGREGGKGKGKGKDNRPKEIHVEENPEDPNYAAKPDREAYEAQSKAIQEKIDGFQKSIQQLTEKINAKGGGRDEHVTQKNQLRAQLDEFKTKIDELVRSKDEYNSQISGERTKLQKEKSDYDKMSKVIGYSDEKDIDQRIAQIEFHMSTTTMKLIDEKECLKEISELKKRRPQVSKLHQMKENLNVKRDQSEIKESIQTINTELNAYRDARKKVQEQYTELMNARNLQLGDFSDLIAQRDTLQKQIKEEITTRNTLRDEFKTAENKHYSYQREIRDKRQALQREQWNEWQEEKKKNDRRRRADMLDTNPHLAHMTLIEQTIHYCKSLLPEEKVAEESKKPAVPEALDGMEVIVKQEDNMEDFYCFKKKSKKKEQKAPEKKTSNMIKHNGHTFALFEQLKMDMPITLDDIPQTLELLKEKLEECEAKTNKFEDEKEEMKAKILGGEDEAGAAPKEETPSAE